MISATALSQRRSERVFEERGMLQEATDHGDTLVKWYPID